MKYIGAIIISFLLSHTIPAQAQMMEAVIMDHKLMDLTADIKSRLDKDGNKCALIKVGLDKPGATFKGDIVGNVSFNANEYCIHMKPNSKTLEISLPGYNTVKVNFKEFGIEEISSRNTYELIVDLKPYATSKEELRIVNLLNEGERFFQDNNHYESYIRYREAAALGNPEAMYWESYFVDNGYDRGESNSSDFEILKKSAQLGYAKAQCLLGSIYLFGGEGVAPNPVEGFRWFLESAKNGYAPGAREAAICYENGTGVSVDLTEAAKWYLMAAQREDPKAQSLIGSCYMIGKGVTKDKIKGSYWITRGAENGCHQGQYLLAMLYKFGSPVYQKNIDKSVEWLRKSASQDFLPAVEALIDGINNGEVKNPEPNELTKLNDTKVRLKLGNK